MANGFRQHHENLLAAHTIEIWIDGLVGATKPETEQYGTTLLSPLSSSRPTRIGGEDDGNNGGDGGGDEYCN